MNLFERHCGVCKVPRPDKGRAVDGRRAYRCGNCGHEWTEGLQGRQQRYSKQRLGNQFANTGAATAQDICDIIARVCPLP